MGEPGPSDFSWNKTVMVKTDDQWILNAKAESEFVHTGSHNTTNISFNYFDPTSIMVKSEQLDRYDSELLADPQNYSGPTGSSSKSLDESDKRVERLIKMAANTAKRLAYETSEERDTRLKQISENAAKRLANESGTHKRAERLAKMSAYAANRLANESPDKRAIRLRRMSEYAAKRLANESSIQRANRLARMSAYAAKRLAKETPEQRKERLARMSAYAAKRHAMKKMNSTNTSNNENNIIDQ